MENKKNGAISQLIEAAYVINEEMPEKIVRKVKGMVQSPASVLIVGIAYKKDVNDLRESPALPIIELLIGEGYEIEYHDHIFLLQNLEIRCTNLLLWMNKPLNKRIVF